MTLPASQLESLELPPIGEVEPEVVKGKSPGRLAMDRFRRDKASMVALTIVTIYIIGSVLAPLLVHFHVIKPYDLHQNLLNVDLGGIPNGFMGGMSWHHILGVEPRTGTDLFGRLWYGLTFSLSIALSASILTMIIGTVMGIVSGASGGWVDAIIGRLVDITLSFPQTLMLLALSAPGVALVAKLIHSSSGAAFPNATYEVVVLAAFGWPSVARLIRGQVLSLRERDFVDASLLLGASRWRLYFKEILPNLWAPVLVQFTLIMPAYVSAEAALGFLGVGIPKPTPTLGNIMLDAFGFASSDFGFFFFPAVLLAVIVISFNLLGDGLRDALDPKADR
ncbi:MAG TPA: ABC transporter permease [Nocardioides sp.]|nr:ABC transporter permease [Nocardioides sp.]